MDDPIYIKELCHRCTSVLEKKEHICIGVSPFNSLFKEEYLDSLIRHCKTNYQSFHLFIPDEATVYTLLALGYDRDRAEKKTKKQVRWLKNKVIKALRANGISELEVNSYLLDGKTLMKNSAFQEELATVHEYFEKDEAFRKHCLEASRWVLENHLPPEEMTEDRLKIAVKYFLYELPLFAATPKIVGTSSSVFCYHQSIDFHKNLYSRQFPYRPSAGQGYGVIQY